MKKAVWGQEYDMHTDSIYQCPSCPDCNIPIFDIESKICMGCGDEVELSQDMITWYEERTGTKEETSICINCGKETMKTMYRRNHVTKEWQKACGSCSNCGVRFIV